MEVPALVTLALKSLRTELIKQGNARRYVNDNVARICRIFKSAASEQLVRADVWNSLKTVEGLPKGRSEAREGKPVRPVDDSVVEATLPHLPPVVADMVRL